MGYETTFTTKSMGDVTIVFDDDEQATIFDPAGNEVGHLHHSQIDDVGFPQLITHIFCEGPNDSNAYKGQGIMAECMRILSQEYEFTMACRTAGGPKYDDGSYLTGDAVRFFDIMESRGWVHRYP